MLMLTSSKCSYGKVQNLDSTANEFSLIERDADWSREGWGLTTRKSLKKEIDQEKNFDFPSYSYTPRGVLALQFYEEEGGTLKLTPREKYQSKYAFC